MRARYYNTDIERFISQDILTGNPENSQSLNRYAYCQGNPVNQNDPFGLCPMGLTTRQWIHLGLDLLGCIPVIGIAANAVNAVLYFQEGDILSGLLSVAGAVIGIGGLSSAIGAAKGICTLAKVGSALKTAGTAVTTAGMAAMTIEGAVQYLQRTKRKRLQDNRRKPVIRRNHLIIRSRNRSRIQSSRKQCKRNNRTHTFRSCLFHRRNTGTYGKRTEGNRGYTGRR